MMETWSPILIALATMLYVWAGVCTCYVFFSFSQRRWYYVIAVPMVFLFWWVVVILFSIGVAMGISSFFREFFRRF